MNLNDFTKLVLERQSCRDFNGESVEKEELQRVLNLSINAPSACNSQPWKIYCVVDSDKVKAVAKSLQDNGVNGFTSEAKAFIVITEKSATLKPRIASKFSEDHFVKYDIGELVAYITLALKAEGLDSCIIGWINKENLRKAVGYSDSEDSNIVIAVGKSDIPVRDKVRNGFDQTVKFI